MSVSPPPYVETQQARSWATVFGAVFAVLAGAFCLAKCAASRNPIFGLFGVVCVLLTFNAIYAFLRNENSFMRVEDGILTWSYPRWPKSSGRVALHGVERIQVDEASRVLEITLRDGTERTIKFLGSAWHLHDYLVAYFPEIAAVLIRD